MQTAATTYFLGSKKSPKLWNELLMKVSSSNLSVGLHRLNVTSVDGEMPQAPTIDWGDGTTTVCQLSAYTENQIQHWCTTPEMHEYAETGDYVVSLDQSINGVQMTNSTANATAYNTAAFVGFGHVDTIATIMNYCFSNPTGLTSITFPDAIQSIGNYAFNQCTKLKYVNLNKVKTLGQRAFQQNTNASTTDGIEHLVLSPNLAEIGPYCFLKNQKLGGEIDKRIYVHPARITFKEHVFNSTGSIILDFREFTVDDVNAGRYPTIQSDSFDYGPYANGIRFSSQEVIDAVLAKSTTAQQNAWQKYIDNGRVIVEST